MKRHPLFVPHFDPTISSWLNLVEGWVGGLTSRRARLHSTLMGQASPLPHPRPQPGCLTVGRIPTALVVNSSCLISFETRSCNSMAIPPNADHAVATCCLPIADFDGSYVDAQQSIFSVSTGFPDCQSPSEEQEAPRVMKCVVCTV